MTPEEEKNKYSRYHTEYITRTNTHIHWYNAVVLMCLYKELPCIHNIPNNLKGTQLHKWMVPDADLESLRTMLGAEIVGEIKVELPTPPSLEPVDKNFEYAVEMFLVDGVSREEAEARAKMIFSGRWEDEE
jgi:hypothetical protein